MPPKAFEYQGEGAPAIRERGHEKASALARHICDSLFSAPVSRQMADLTFLQNENMDSKRVSLLPAALPLRHSPQI